MEFDVVLASASPRRRDLLSQAGVTFRVHAVDVDESLAPELLDDAEKAVKHLAQLKAKTAVEQLVTPEYDGMMAVLGCDTVVVLRGQIFGKPHDAEEAHRMLSALSGCGHQVHTAVSLWLVNAKKDEEFGLAYRTFVDTTYVYFKELGESDIAAYIESGDPFDKAGAYGIQSGGSAFIDHIEGSLDTVIGLPVARLLEEYPDVFSV